MIGTRACEPGTGTAAGQRGRGRSKGPFRARASWSTHCKPAAGVPCTALPKIPSTLLLHARLLARTCSAVHKVALHIHHQQYPPQLARGGAVVRAPLQQALLAGSSRGVRLCKRRLAALKE